MSERNLSRSNPNSTHKALLIGIEPIKKETAEDIVRDIVDGDIGIGLKRELITRCIQVLEESGHE